MPLTAWDDEALLSYEFDIVGRPDLDETLSSQRPATGEKLNFLQAYNITPPSDLPDRRQACPLVWCALCQEPTHWVGWKAEVVDADPPRQLLVGRVCASKKGKTALRVAQNDFDARRARADGLRARKAVLACRALIRTALISWRASPSITELDAWLAALKKHTPIGLLRLAEAARVSPAALQVESKVRDYAAEQELERRGKRRPDSPPIEKVVFSTVATIACPALYGRLSPGGRIEDWLASFDLAGNALAQPTKDLSTKQIQLALRDLRNVWNGIHALADSLSNVSKSFEGDHLDKVIRWLNQQPRTSGSGPAYKRRGSRLIYSPPSGAEVSIKIPGDEIVVAPDALKYLDRALLGHAGQ